MKDRIWERLTENIDDEIVVDLGASFMLGYSLLLHISATEFLKLSIMDKIVQSIFYGLGIIIPVFALIVLGSQFILRIISFVNITWKSVYGSENLIFNIEQDAIISYGRSMTLLLSMMISSFLVIMHWTPQVLGNLL
jgi:hypothetical protein